MAEADSGVQQRRGGAFEPLREPVFRRIWTASLLSNFGQLILGVGVAWEMTRLTNSPAMVALVQTALMLPLFLVAVPAGAIADMFDRRKVAMAGLAFSILFAVILTALAWMGLTTPWILLAFCFLIGAGVALYSPSWQASIGEQVAPAQLPAAIALGSISYNVARSFGPALGGLIVLAAGAKAVFAITAFGYLPLFLMFLIWRRRHMPSRLPPERIDRAIVSGARYAIHSGPIRAVLARLFLFGLASATASALAPLIAKDLLHGDAATYGLLLGAAGIGAVAGALLVSRVRERMSTELAVRLLAVTAGIALLIAGFSRSLPLTCLGLFLSGGANIMTIALLNITVQLSAPRWVAARALSLFSSAITGGVAVGAWFWGQMASDHSVEVAVIASGVVVLAMPLISLLMPLPSDEIEDVSPAELREAPDAALALTHRSGPIVLEIDYRVDPGDARDFYDAMQKVQRARQRNGAFEWSIARDINDPAIWTERYHCPTWGDYLRMRTRITQADLAAQAHADSFDRTPDGQARVRRRLERPYGSVRWRADSPDPHAQEPIGYLAP